MYQWITLAFLSRSEKRTLWRILRVNDIFGWHREGYLNNGAKFQTPKVEKCNSAAMVDKWPKFLKSTPGFPRELKMGIFAASEKGEIFGGGKLRQFWQHVGEGVTLEPAWGWEHSDLLPTFAGYLHVCCNDFTNIGNGWQNQKGRKA